MEARVSVRPEGRVAVHAPRVGRFTPRVRTGSVVLAADVIGHLRVLGREIAVVLPADVGGRVERLATAARDTPVEYGEALLDLAPIDDVGVAGVAVAAAAEDAELGPGEELLRSPIEGQFYRRPAPEEPPYVEEGAAIAAGSVLGLVEVMKFFHPVRFERVGQWSLVRFVVDEGAAVDSGAPLAVIRKLEAGS